MFGHGVDGKGTELLIGDTTIEMNTDVTLSFTAYSMFFANKITDGETLPGLHFDNPVFILYSPKRQFCFMFWRKQNPLG